MVRQRRAEEIDQGLSRALSDGLGALFLTLTVRHHSHDALALRLDTMSQALGLVLKGSPWNKRKGSLGFIGAIRAVEITWGEANGWHPHVHAVLLFERPLDDAEVLALRAWIAGRWERICERHGFGTINEHGVDLRRVGSTEIAGYLTKVEGGWGVGLELARADLKSGRHSTVPAVALLSEFAETGDARMLRLWLEYERATSGKRAIVWSPGLRARLLGDELEESDEVLAASEGVDLALFRHLVESEEWHRWVKSGDVGTLLTEVEKGAETLLFLFDALGIEVTPLDTTEVEHAAVG